MLANLKYSKSQQLKHAALLIEALPKSDAVKLLSRLTPEQVSAVLAAFRTIDASDHRELSDAIVRFSRAAAESAPNATKDAAEVTFSCNSQDATKRDIADSLPTIALPRHQKPATETNPFDFLLNVDHHLRVIALATASPRDIAIVLSALPPKTSSATLASFSNQQQRCDVMRQVCLIGEITESDLAELRFSIGQNLKKALADETAIAEKKLAIATCSGVPTSNSAEQSITTIERIDALSDGQIKTILQSCDTSLWAPALKNAPVRVREKIFKCMAKTPASLLKMEIQQLPPVNSREEVIARQRIVKTVYDLASDGQILIGPKAA